MVASSKYLGVLPESLGNMEVVDWIPVDVLSEVMIELVGQVLEKKENLSAQTAVYNLVNPKATTWSSLSNHARGLVDIPKIVSLDEWIKRLEESSREKKGAFVETNPAVKLRDFFRALSDFETGMESNFEVGKLVRNSREAEKLEAVSKEWMKLWIDQWKILNTFSWSEVSLTFREVGLGV